jgi:hypothetical protein
VEIKIIDKCKGYGKNRIKEGFTQVFRYANDYNKEPGYLVVFNVENIEINFTFLNKIRRSLQCYRSIIKRFFVVVNVYESASASKLGTLESIQILETDLFN